MQVDAISLYAKYTETFQRLRPPNTLQPVLWNDLPSWLQAVWVELAIWIDSEPGPTMDGYEYKEVNGVLYARRNT